MKGKKFLAFAIVCVLVSIAVSAEAFSLGSLTKKIPKVSNSTKEGAGNAFGKVMDYLGEREKTKQAEAESRKQPGTTIINNNTTNNTVNNNINVNNDVRVNQNNNINQTQINQTQVNQTQNIGTNGGGVTGSAGMRVSGGAAGVTRNNASRTPFYDDDDDDYYGSAPARTQPQQQRVQPQQRRAASANPAAELRVSMKNMGSRIIANNAPSYEIQLAKNELPARVKTRFNKVCTTSRTVVVGDAGSNKKYGAFCMVTSDPSITFAGGIRVGAPVSTVENFFGKSISQLTTQPGRAHITTDNSVEIDILYSGNKITQIGYYDSNSLSCQRTGNFFTRKVNEMGMRNMY